MANVTRLQEHATWTKAGPVVSRMSEDEIAALEEQTMATVGDPTTLGLWAFATGTWIAGTVIGGIFTEGAITGTAPMLLIFAGIAQFIAGLYAYRRAQSLSATAFCCFGSFSATIGTLLLLQAGGVLANNPAGALLEGFFFESFAFIALTLALAAMEANMAFVAVLGILGIGYALAGIPYLTGMAAQGGYGIIGNIGGWFLVASALCAYYAGAAMIVNSTWRRPALPLGGAP